MRLTACRYNYYGEILMDRGEFTSAMENLDKAIALERLKKECVVASHMLRNIPDSFAVAQPSITAERSSHGQQSTVLVPVETSI